jgi:hypothetical protein
MHSLRSRLLALGLLAAAASAFVVWRRGHDTPAAALDDPSLVDGRVWVEKRPDKHTDYVHSAFFVSRVNLAVFERASSYDVRFELAELTRDKERLRVFFPQTSRDAKVTYRVRSCTDVPPFDLCLDLGDNPWGGPRRYYGFTNPDDERASLGDLAGELRAAVEARAR